MMTQTDLDNWKIVINLAIVKGYTAVEVPIEVAKVLIEALEVAQGLSRLQEDLLP